jgi:O-methyltransferase involved in polyketide biosynthesis
VRDGLLSATATPGVDLQHPSVARVYDFLLDGSTYWAMDASFGRRLLDQFPEFRDIAKANRVFLHRVVRHLAGEGVRQFIDIGSGVLSRENTHQIADDAAPGTKVVYVDNEPVAVAHAELLLDEEGDPDRHAVVKADLRTPHDLWERAFATGVLDRREPVAVLMFAVLHSLRPEPGDRDPAAQLMAHYRELLPEGSYLGVSHVTTEDIPGDLPAKLAGLRQLYKDRLSTRAYCRSQDAINALLGDFEVLSPGMVWIPEWHPEESTADVSFPTPNHSGIWAGVGRKQRRAS